MLEAVVLINVHPGQMRSVSEALVGRDGVHELYSVAGAYDLVAILRTPRNERLEELVTGEIAAVPGVAKTTTLVAFRCLSRRDSEGVFSLGLEPER
ncbi:MAG: Lrp/AsnC ligand binding domain-containing protein [Thermoanaerobaculaceae bacterium]|jgi:DNA-binding Lrp family transcriptional regulator|nr:Lrp/AsnC ligand binding domain-containing protein [Thermoanaerobaculaceae bacterium]